jgi:hypothetical protein
MMIDEDDTMHDTKEPGLIERLRVPSDSEETMKAWDGLRAYLLEGGKGSLARDIFESILSNIDEERAEAATRIEELERALQAKSRAVITYPPLRYVGPVGEGLQEMRDNVRTTDLYEAGDTQLVWVNQGDLLMHAHCAAVLVPLVDR